MRILGDYHSNYISSAANLAFLWVGAEIQTREGWMLSLILIFASSFIAWLANVRRRRTIVSIPTSMIASAAQGYVELQGRAIKEPHDRLAAPLSGKPCVWFRYRSERRTSENKWETIGEASSDDTILIDDNTGRCNIDTDGAEVYTTHHKRWYDGEYRQTEWLLLPGDTIYAVGQFETINADTHALDEKQEIAALLAQWKRDRTSLLQRFDRNRDGEIDLEEWEVVRRAAAEEVASHARETRLRDGYHLLKRPAGRFFLISNLAPERFARRYLIWAWYHFVMIFASSTALGYLINQPGWQA